jgi:hypothetical protein
VRKKERKRKRDNFEGNYDGECESSFDNVRILNLSTEYTRYKPAETALL